MTLKEFIASLPDEAKFRIGTEDGSKFVFTGEKKGFKFSTLNRNISNIHKEKLKKLIEEFSPTRSNKNNNPVKKEFEDTLDKMLNMVPMEHREVIETIESDIGKDTIIYVKGDEDGWLDFGLELGELKSNSLNDDAMKELLYAIHKQMTDELTSLYKRCRVHQVKGHEEDTKRLLQEIRQTERDIRQNPYEFFQDPNAVIKSCQKAAQQRFEEWEKEEARKRKKTS